MREQPSHREMFKFFKIISAYLCRCQRPNVGVEYWIFQASVLSWNSWNSKSCPEIYSITWIFADVLEFLSTPVNAASVRVYTIIYIGFREWMTLPNAHVCLRPNCGPWKLKDILVLWHCWRYETNSALMWLVPGNYCIFGWL